MGEQIVIFFTLDPDDVCMLRLRTPWCETCHAYKIKFIMFPQSRGWLFGATKREGLRRGFVYKFHHTMLVLNAFPAGAILEDWFKN